MWSRIFLMTTGSSMQAITLAAPPQAWQVVLSMSPKAPTFGEYPLEPLCPCHGGMALGRCSVYWFVGRSGFSSLSTSGGRDGCPVLAVGCEHAVETGEVDAGFGHQGGEACDEIQRLEDHMGGAITPGVLEGVSDLAVFGE
jgi:hypothetical protein